MGTLHRLTCTWICFGAASFAACAKSERNAAMDTSAMAGATTAGATTAPAAAPATATPISLDSVAGRWNFRAVPESGDTTPTTYVLTATGKASGWTITFPGRAPIAVQVTVAGDSLITSMAPNSSLRRKGQQVTTNSVLRLQGGNLVGTTVAHYPGVKTADSVLTLRTQGARAK